MAEPIGGRSLDLITVGRSSVDLYGEQVGGRLEDIGSFAKYVGGSPTNTAVGAARLGLRAGLLTRVGDDHFGRFIREEVARCGVDVSGVLSDSQRLTALAVLGIRDQSRFPLLFYRENCADMALCEADVDPAFIGRAAAVLINGTHLSQPGVRAASRKAAQLARAAGGRVVFDIDYRPVLWGLTAPDAGENRYVASAAVTERLQEIAPLCDLIVGTEEEFHILGGSTDTMSALRAVRALTPAMLVCKLGADGCVAFEGAVGEKLDSGIKDPGFDVEVFNILGAGDAFMSGFLRGWLRGLPIETCCKYANACGAIVVSRHGCAPAMPTWAELSTFLEGTWPRRLRESRGAGARALGHDACPAASGAVGTRDGSPRAARDAWRPSWTPGSRHWRHSRHWPSTPSTALRAVTRASGFCSTAGSAAQDWSAPPSIRTGSGGRSSRAAPGLWPSMAGRMLARHCVPGRRITWSSAWSVTIPKIRSRCGANRRSGCCACYSACRETRHELLLEVIASPYGKIQRDTTARVLERLYDLGVRPDWWKLEPSEEPAAWAAIQDTIRRRDPWCRGVLVLGLASDAESLASAFQAAAPFELVRGFAVGRTIFAEPARRRLAGEIGDAETVAALAANLQAVVAAWRRARPNPPA